MPKRGTLLVIAILVVAQALAWLTTSSGSGDPAPIATHLVPMRLGDWQGRDLGPLGDVTQEMLQPDAVVSRAYQDSAGRAAELMIVYGHRKQTFHSPGQCLLGGGWNIISKQQARAALGDRNVVVNRFLVQKGRRRALVFYAYAQGHRVTPSWVKHQLYLAAERARGRPGTGALVRITVPLVGDLAATQRVGLRFAEAVLPSVSRSLEAS